ncbi:MAG: Gfo/Idh/MocA family protein [Solirubrobacterales bacterium]
MAEIGIGIVGTGFMARVHALGMSLADSMFDLPIRPRLVAYCGRETTAPSALPRWPEFLDAQPVQGLEGLLSVKNIDLYVICTPNAAHSAAALAALDAGGNVLCEKPLASRIQDSLTLVRRAEATSTTAGVSFNYRRVPAVELTRAMIRAGDIGTPSHFAGAYLQDWGHNSEAQLTWRHDPVEAGPGVITDTGCHIIDLAQHLTDSHVTAVAAIAPTSGSDSTKAAGGPDAASLMMRLASGASACFDLSRVAAGHRNGLAFEIRGSEGSIRFSLERMNELEVSGFTGSGETWRRLYVTERSHPWLASRWPPGHPLSWEHTFAHQAADLLSAIATGRAFSPNFPEAHAIDVICATAAAGMMAGSWRSVDTAAP